MNPKLLAVLDKISAILKEADLAGSIVITDGIVADFRLHLTASWSCAYDEYDADGHLIATRIKCTPEMEPEKEKRKQRIERTTGAAMGLIQGGDYHQENLFKITEMLSHHYAITHTARLEPPPGSRLGDLPGDADTHFD